MVVHPFFSRFGTNQQKQEVKTIQNGKYILFFKNMVDKFCNMI